jgi:ABC-type amino acid transport substrate-binding protein
VEASKIKGIDDLKGKTVGILKGSVAGKPLHDRQIKIREFEGIPELMRALSQEAIDALLADEPSIKYYLLHHPDLNVAPVGPLVRYEKYAFAVRRNSPLRIPLSKEVVSAAEGGFLKQWHDHYFEVH